MTTFSTSFTSRYGDPAIEYRGAHLWVHRRHSATVVTITGRIDGANVSDVTRYAIHPITADTPVILDLNGVTSFADTAVPLLSAVDERCREVGTEWALVAGDAVSARLKGRDGDLALPVVGTVAGAEHEFDDAVLKRRRLLLPLLSKTA